MDKHAASVSADSHLYLYVELNRVIYKIQRSKCPILQVRQVIIILLDLFQIIIQILILNNCSSSGVLCPRLCRLRDHYGEFPKPVGHLRQENKHLVNCHIKTIDYRIRVEKIQRMLDFPDLPVDFIELCGWFEEDMTREVIAAVDGSVPIGSCGI